MRQVSLKVPEPKSDSRSLHDIRVAIIREFGPRKLEHLASQLGASKGHLSEVMSGNSGKHWPDEWTDYVEEHFDHRAEIAAYHARKRGLEVRQPRTRTPAEELRRLKHVLRRHTGMGLALLQEADDLPDEAFAEDDQ